MQESRGGRLEDALEGFGSSSARAARGEIERVAAAVDAVITWPRKDLRVGIRSFSFLLHVVAIRAKDGRESSCEGTIVLDGLVNATHGSARHAKTANRTMFVLFGKVVEGSAGAAYDSQMHEMCLRTRGQILVLGG